MKTLRNILTLLLMIVFTVEFSEANWENIPSDEYDRSDRIKYNTVYDFIGEVVAVEESEILLKTEYDYIYINTSRLPNNPLDENGLIQLDLSDKVKVKAVKAINDYGEKELFAIYVLEVARTR